MQRILVLAAAGWLSLLTPRPDYAPLFAPLGARAAAYQFYVSASDLPAVLRSLASEPSLLHPPGAWTPTALLPADAFGGTGAYANATGQMTELREDDNRNVTVIEVQLAL